MEGREPAEESRLLGARTSNMATPILIRHDSEFSVNTAYTAGTEDVPRLNVWQGAALLTAE